MSEKDTIVRVDANAPVEDETDWEAFDAFTDEEVTAATQTDADNPPLTEQDMAKMRRVPNVRAIRKAQGLSQADRKSVV